MEHLIIKIFFCLVFPVFAYASVSAHEFNMALMRGKYISSFGSSVHTIKFSNGSVAKLMYSFAKDSPYKAEVIEDIKRFLGVSSDFLIGQTVQGFILPFTESDKCYAFLFLHSAYDVVLLKLEGYTEIQDFLKIDSEEKELYLVKVLKHICGDLGNMTNDEILLSDPFKSLFGVLAEVKRQIYTENVFSKES